MYVSQTDALIYRGRDAKIMEDKVRSLIQLSRTNDLSDVAGRYAPNVDILSKENSSRTAEDFIDTCSMNGKHCSHRFINRN